MTKKSQFIIKWNTVSGIGMLALTLFAIAIAIAIGFHFRESLSVFFNNQSNPRQTEVGKGAAVEDEELAKFAQSYQTLSNTITAREYRLSELTRRTNLLSKKTQKTVGLGESVSLSGLGAIDIQSVNARFERLANADQLLVVKASSGPNFSPKGKSSLQGNLPSISKVDTPEWQAVFEAYANETGIDANEVRRMMIGSN
ncbi:MAG: hypothetical protein GKR96_07690 [Gammaproteobacteria bacterium]|nr:hypothetical protein [Gammaproteobacteria bacterium]